MVTANSTERARGYHTFVIAALFLVNYMDRMDFSLVIEPIKA